MFKKVLQYLEHITWHLIIVMFFYTLTRAVFYAANMNLYDAFTLPMILGGLRFDASVVVLTNGLLIILTLLPFPFRYSNWFFQVFRILFVLINSVALAFNLIDVAYVRFTLKRTASDLFTTQGLGTDILQLAPQFAADFWWLIVFFIAIVWALFKVAAPIKKINLAWWWQIPVFIIVSGICVIFQRGGLQVKPLMLIHANEYTTSDKAPVVLNTPFSIIRTLGNSKLQPINYFSEEEVKTIFNPKQSFVSDRNKPYKKRNVCIIILESFSHENVGALSGLNNYTPFLDSLINHAYVFENAFANGQKSVESLPSILASLPSLMSQPYISSPYSSNQISGLGTILKKQGYHTSFFHGGTNGTMGFDLFSALAGFDYYYGKEEFKKYEGSKPEDDDGHWGIFDEPFLQFFSTKLSEFKEPFATSIFTLSSHHPYKIPEKHKAKFTNGHLDLHNSISYTDYALKQFFEAAKKQIWFKNTLFVITADHTSLSENTFYINRSGNFKVPLLFYAPDFLEKRRTKKLAQHLDITPSILDLLNLKTNFYGFGTSLFSNKKGIGVVNHKSNLIQIQNDEQLISFDGENVMEYYNLKTDPNCLNNKVNKVPSSEYTQIEKEFRAIYQTYVNDLINNRTR